MIERGMNERKEENDWKRKIRTEEGREEYGREVDGNRRGEGEGRGE